MVAKGIVKVKCTTTGNLYREPDYEWDEFFDVTNNQLKQDIHSGVPIKGGSGQGHSFIHKSLQEFFLQKKYLKRQ